MPQAIAAPKVTTKYFLRKPCALSAQKAPTPTFLRTFCAGHAQKGPASKCRVDQTLRYGFDLFALNALFAHRASLSV
jgi:hypothetical protein